MVAPLLPLLLLGLPAAVLAAPFDNVTSSVAYATLNATAAAVTSSTYASATEASTAAVSTASPGSQQPPTAPGEQQPPSAPEVTQTNTLPKTPFIGPTPETRGEGAWADAVGKARAFIADWTIEQKANVTTGTGWQAGRCVGNIGNQPDVGFPNGLCLQDSPMGIRFADFVTSFPAGINAASTFDRDLIRARGLAMGQEFRGKGVNIALGPMSNMGRVAQGGRNWEGFGEDPYLSGEASYATIKGMQTPGQGTQACMKHYIGNEEELNRTKSSSNIDDRTMHEVYLHPFLKAVQADVASMMCSYNLLNQTFACENSKVQNDLLKHELGFQGSILSDWQATMSGVPSILGGLDMTMPGDIVFNSNSTYFGANLTAAVTNGSVPVERLDDMATRILAGWYLLEQDKDDFPLVNFDSWKPSPGPTNEQIDVQDDHAKVVREVGAASTVLLKNENGALPLSGLRTIALIGNDAGPSTRGPNGYADRGGNEGILAQGWGSGSSEYTYLISPLEAIQAKARETRTSVSWWLNNYDLGGANTTAQRKDAALVFINADSGEQYITVDQNEGDRKNLTAWMGGDELVKAVAANNNNTIVIVHSVGPLILEPWIDHPNVTAVVWAGLPGQEAGNSLVDVLYGAYNPSGRLPYTIAKQPSDYSAQINFTGGQDAFPQVDYTEELNIGYRHFLSEGIEPRFGFGFGLSYTDFSYGGLEVVEAKMTKRHWEESQEYEGDSGFHGKVGASLAGWLHAPRYHIEFDVTNTGSVYGCDIPQLYLAFPESAGEPPRVLRGFERVSLSPGETTRVSLPLSQYEMSVWDVVSQRWVKPEGEFGVVVGKNAFDVQLEGTIY